MTHHIIKSLAAVALGAMLLTGSVVAQNGYHQVGDTVRGKCPIYQYEQGWWPTLNASGHTDSLINTAFSTFGYMKHTTNTPLKVIGIASTWARLDRTTMQEDLDPSIDGSLYYVLCDATAGGLVELARVYWTDDYSTHPTRYMELPRRGGAASCDQMLDYTAIVPLREYYFDSAITVTDSFYLGCVVPDIDASGPNAFNIFTYIASHMWDYCTYSSMEADGTYKDCAIDLPEFTYYDSSALDNNWHHFTHKRLQLIFPIIELDTTQPDTVWRTVTAMSADDGLGEVSGGGIYPDSSWVTITANPYALDCIGCHIEFDHWNDSDTTNPRLVFVISDTTFTAYFRMVEDSTEGINELSIFNSQFSIYPNPATHQVSIECAETISEAWLTNLTGRREQMRLTAEGTGRYSLDLTSRPQATYLLTLTTASGKTHTIRLLKQSDISR